MRALGAGRKSKKRMDPAMETDIQAKKDLSVPVSYVKQHMSEVTRCEDVVVSVRGSSDERKQQREDNLATKSQDGPKVSKKFSPGNTARSTANEQGKVKKNTTLHKEHKVQSSASSTNHPTTQRQVTGVTERGDKGTRRSCAGICFLREVPYHESGLLASGNHENNPAVKIILKLLIVFSFLLCALAKGPCQSPQHLQLGSTGVVKCAFQRYFPIISWFNSTNTQDHPLVTMTNDHIAGYGFSSGGFDIDENGSLIIRSVSLEHEHTFCVVTLTDPNAEMTTHCVEVVTVGLAEDPCSSPQHLQLGSTGMVNCAFQRHIPIMSWFSSTNIKDHPLVTTNSDGKSGRGYSSGDFDIAESGSLIIRNVSLQHEHTFCVVTLANADAAMITHCVDVVTVVFPEQRKPHIAGVRDCPDEICFAQYFEDSIIRCSVENARPSVNLTWAVRSGLTDQTISHQSSRIPSVTVSGAFTSSSTLADPFMYSKTLALAVCKANSQPNMFNQSESLLLLQNMASDLHHVASGPLYAAVESTVVLHCPKMEANLLVWNWKSKDSQHMAMVAYVVFSESLFVSPSDEKLSLDPDGSLVISDVPIESRGTYICLAGDGQHEEARSYDVNVYAPSYPEVGGCGSDGYCVLHAEKHDRLTCIIRSVPGGVRLGFTALSPQEASITFLEREVEERDAGDFVDVSVTATYKASGSGVSTYECGVIGEHKELFVHTAVFSLYVEQDSTTRSPYDDTTTTTVEPNRWRTALVIVIVLIAASVSLLIGYAIGVRHRGKETAERRIPQDPELVVHLTQ